MPVFLTERIRDIKGWIPPEDIDGLDVFRSQYCREAENVDFESGFIRNVRKPVVVSYPLAVTGIINTDWKVINLKFFRHSKQGMISFYIIQQISTGELKFILTDNLTPDGIELQVFDGKITVPTDTPVEINYMIVDDQLKINLNTVFAYVNTDATDVYMNLTLLYMEEQDSRGVFPGRSELWYLTPRWLGWSFFDDRVNFQDTSPSDIIIDVNTYTTYTHSGVTTSPPNLILAPGAFIRIANLRAVGGVKIDQSSGGAGDLIVIKIYDNDGSYIETSFEPNAAILGDFEVNWQYLFPVGAIAEVSAHLDNSGNVLFVSATWGALSAETVLLGRTGDKQVMPIRSYLLGDFPVLDFQILEMPAEDWDYRLDMLDLELYVDNGTGILLKYTVIPLSITAGTGSNWDVELRVVSSDDHPLRTAPTTLNFTYGLGAQIKPFHEEDDFILSTVILNRGDLIYSEVTYKGREYYVRDDNRLYMSHIAGNGLLQPDSFPFDADLEFGFNRSDYEFDILKSLVITPLDEILVNADQDNIVYTIQQGQTLIYRRIKTVNGSIGLSSRQSLLRSDKGLSISKGLFWVNPQGIYAYSGGTKEPDRLTEIKLRHYWQSQIDDTSVITMFDPYKNEILFTNNKNIIVFDLTTAEWKTYKFDTNVKQFVGLKDSIPHFLGVDNILYKIDQSSNTFFEGKFVTHDTTNYSVNEQGKPSPLSELDDKIFQELYSSVTNKLGASVIVNIYADDNLIEGSIGLSTTVNFQNTLSWLLIRYKRVRLEVFMTPGNIELREIGYTFTVPMQAPASAVHTKEGGFGFDFGKVYGH